MSTMPDTPSSRTRSKLATAAAPPTPAATPGGSTVTRGMAAADPKLAPPVQNLFSLPDPTPKKLNISEAIGAASVVKAATTVKKTGGGGDKPDSLEPKNLLGDMDATSDPTTLDDDGAATKTTATNKEPVLVDESGKDDKVHDGDETKTPAAEDALTTAAMDANSMKKPDADAAEPTMEAILAEEDVDAEIKAGKQENAIGKEAIRVAGGVGGALARWTAYLPKMFGAAHADKTMEEDMLSEQTLAKDPADVPAEAENKVDKETTADKETTGSTHGKIEELSPPFKSLTFRPFNNRFIKNTILFCFFMVGFWMALPFLTETAASMTVKLSERITNTSEPVAPETYKEQVLKALDQGWEAMKDCLRT